MYWIAPVAFVLLVLFSAIKVLNEYERGVIFTLGRYTGTKGPGIIFVIPMVQRMVKMDLRTIVLDVPRRT
jgi:regulator of protease activity HflC (stomatin/prohibitin superfamily)